MTLKKSDIKKLSGQTRIPVKDLTNAIEAEEETSLEFVDVESYTKEELNERDLEQIKKAGKAEVEIAVKKARSKLVEEFGEDYNFEGKIVDNLYDALKKAAADKAVKDADKEPNETIEQQKGKIEKLQQNLEKIEAEKQQEIDRLTAEKDRLIQHREIENTIPKDLDTPLTHKDITTLFNSDIEVTKDEDGNEILKKDGNVIVHEKTQKPKTKAEYIPEWLEEKGIKSKEDAEGRGEGDKGKKFSGNGDIKSIKTTADFDEYCEKNNIKQSGMADILKKVQKENPEFVYGE